MQALINNIDFNVNNTVLLNNLIQDYKTPSAIQKADSSTVLIWKGAVVEISKKAKDALKKLESFKELKSNWDSYNTSPVSRVAIENAKNFIKKADRDSLNIYFTAPGRDGEVMVEIQNEYCAEIYFDDDGSNELIIFKNTESILEGSLEENYPDLKKYLI